MPVQVSYPGVDVEEVSTEPHAAELSTETLVAFLGRTASGPLDEPRTVRSFAEFVSIYGDLVADLPLPYSVRDFFQNGGEVAVIARLRSGGVPGEQDAGPLVEEDYLGDSDRHTGVYLLDAIPALDLLCVPPDERSSLDPVATATHEHSPAVHRAIAAYCASRRCVYLVDPPQSWHTAVAQSGASQALTDVLGIEAESDSGAELSSYAAAYFPNYLAPDPMREGTLQAFAPGGAIAGVIAATDKAVGRWKAAAGLSAQLTGVSRPTLILTDEQDEQLADQGINCLRTFPNAGTVIWGARTLSGTKDSQSDWRYLPVRRLMLQIERDLSQAMRFAAFQVNDETLWSSLRLLATNYLADLSRKGAFYNYSVRCDATTTTAEDIARGVVNVVVMVAPIKPAEFVVVQLQQLAATSAA